MTMKRKRRSRRDAMDWIELSRDATRFDKDFQYLSRVIRLCTEVS